MYSAKDIAEFFLVLASKKFDERLSNLKLQKLLYYSQGYHLAIYNKPLFNDEIHAWQYGPVIKNLYHIYKDFSANVIPIPEELQIELSSEESGFLAEIFEVYGQYSAWRLAEMTHLENPWKDVEINEIITNDSMKKYFSKIVE